MAAEYCSHAGIAVGQDNELIQRIIPELHSRIEATVEERISSGEPLYQYRVPKLGEGGACSLFGQLAPEPYDLRGAIGESDAKTRFLARLDRLVEATHSETKADWVSDICLSSNVQRWACTCAS